MWNGEDEVFFRNNECLHNVKCKKYKKTQLNHDICTTLHKSGGWHKLNKIYGFVLYCRKTDGSGWKTEYCLSLNYKFLFHILLDNLDKLRVFYTNRKRCNQYIQELASLYKYLK